MLIPFFLLLACSSDSADGDLDIDLEVEAEVAELVSTVVQVSWTADEDVDAATLYVETGLGESWEQDITEGSATVWGLPPEEDVMLYVTVESDGDTADSEVLTVETGSPDRDLPTIDIEGDEDRALDGQLILTTIVTNPGAAVVLDGQGRYRWWATFTESEQLARARLSQDGQTIMSMPVNVDGRDDTGLLRYALDGTLVDSVQVDGQHHDFVEHSDGTLAFLVHAELREGGGQPAIGDKLVEVAPDGTQTEIWNIWDWLDESDADSVSNGEGWSHANSLVFDEAEQTYTIGFLGIRALVQLDRASGEPTWWMGTDLSDFELANGDTTILDRSHQFEFLDGTLLVFENRDPSLRSSRAVEFTFSPDEAVMEEVWSFEADPSLYCNSMGDVERLDSGDTLVDYSFNGTMIQADADGEEVWRLSTSIGAALGYVSVLGEPGSF